MFLREVCQSFQDFDILDIKHDTELIYTSLKQQNLHIK